jgi:hypothetical protein
MPLRPPSAEALLEALAAVKRQVRQYELQLGRYRETADQPGTKQDQAEALTGLERSARRIAGASEELASMTRRFRRDAAQAGRLGGMS